MASRACRSTQAMAHGVAEPRPAVEPHPLRGRAAVQWPVTPEVCPSHLPRGPSAAPGDVLSFLRGMNGPSVESFGGIDGGWCIALRPDHWPVERRATPALVFAAVLT